MDLPAAPSSFPYRPTSKPGLAERLVRSPLGALTQSRWFDPVGLFALRRLFFPLSRLWAAAGVADGAVARFVEEAQLGGRIAHRHRHLGKVLERHRRLRQAHNAAEQAWAQAFFGATPWVETELAQIAADRLDAAHRLTMDRASFYPLLLAGAKRQVDWHIPPADEVEAVYGPLLHTPAAAYAFPDPVPTVEHSRRIPGRHGMESWLRFSSPSDRMNDTAYAHIVEPFDNPDAPTIVIGNGVCMEPEMMRGMVDAAATMGRLGFRAVEITTPWHERRCPEGWYGGEKFFATAPIGQIDLFTAQARETAVVIEWCRRRFGGPVALAGISLGSFVGQLVASHAVYWPKAAQPDALLLITHNGSMEEVVFDSQLVENIGIPAALARGGWTDADIVRWAPLMDPPGPPVMASDRIVSILGTVDRVTPVQGGLELARRWQVPADNLFVMPRGHFGTPLSLVRDPAPLLRLKAILQS